MRDGELYQNTNGGSIDTFQTADIDSLGVITKPITKVDTLDEHRSPFLSVKEGDGLENIFNICAADERVAPHS